MRLAVIALTVACAACGDGAPGTSQGTLLYSEAGSGDLVALDIARDSLRVIATGGPYRTIVADADADQIAFTGFTRPPIELYRTSFDGNRLEAITAVPYGRELTLGTGGWTGYYTGTAYEYVVVLPGSTEGRALVASPRYVHQVVSSPLDDRLVYNDCLYDGVSCVADLVVERADGSERTVVAEGIPPVWELMFTPDGTAVIGSENRNSPTAEDRVVMRPISGGAPVDLGPGHVAYPAAGGGVSPLSPDGREVLITQGDGAHQAVTLDGGGVRTFETVAGSASFTGAGVLFNRCEFEFPSEFEEYYYCTHYIEDDAGARTLMERNEECLRIHASPTGELIAYACSNGQMIVQRVADGEYVHSSSFGIYETVLPIAFSHDERLVLFQVGAVQLWAAELDGQSRQIGELYSAPYAGSSEFAFVP